MWVLLLALQPCERSSGRRLGRPTPPTPGMWPAEEEAPQPSRSWIETSANSAILGKNALLKKINIWNAGRFLIRRRDTAGLALPLLVAQVEEIAPPPGSRCERRREGFGTLLPSCKSFRHPEADLSCCRMDGWHGNGNAWPPCDRTWRREMIYLATKREAKDGVEWGCGGQGSPMASLSTRDVPQKAAGYIPQAMSSQ